MRDPHPFAAAPRHPNGPGGGSSSAKGQPFSPAAKGADAQAINAIIQRAVIRLVEIVEQETAALRDHTAIDLKEYNNRKAHGLLDLDRAVSMLDGLALDAATTALLAGLREKLNTNSRVLAVHIEAVREVASVIADTIREAESDGTYTHSYRSKG